MKIPDQVKKYKPFGNGKRYTEKKHYKILVYRPCKGEEIDVLFWQRYPSYDFIFGVPSKGNRFHGVEAAFFQYRDVRKKKVRHGFYLDKVELKQFVKGFMMCLKHKGK